MNQTSSLRESILLILRERGSRVLSAKDLVSRLESGGIAVTREEVEAEVAAMESDGKIVAIRGRRFSLPEFTPFVTGEIRIHSDGHGTIRQEPGREELFVDRRGTKGSMNGDLVVARAEKGADNQKQFRGKRYVRGEVTRILRRRHRTVVGRFHGGPPAWIRPFDIRLDTDINVELQGGLEALDGQMVNVEIIRYPGADASATGRVIEVLGFIWEPGVDIEVAIRKYDLPHRFDEGVQRESEAIPIEIGEADLVGRKDLRSRQIVTIDGESARDFDDAVEVTTLESGGFRLGVHIADVSHYVAEGSILDREAFERGTSVYFPGRVVPMLPERLSNGICSLNPNVDRLAFSVEIDIDSNGRFIDRRFFRSVIRTCERMTYTDVCAILESPTRELEDRYRGQIDHFRRMKDLFAILNRRRDARGSLDFDLPQHEVLLSEEGGIETIRASERNTAHRIIEEFMLAANEVVAQELFFANQPALYRVHAPPDPMRVEDLKEIVQEFGHKLRANSDEIQPRDLRRIIRDVEGTEEERFFNELILRSLSRAVYSQDCDGHFALALSQYGHFTSPIRRYPDLVVHRRLGALLDRGPMLGDELERAERTDPGRALQCSERERRAESAEREVLEWKKVIFMRDKVGEKFEGRITGVMPFGLFIELDQFFVQGLVPIATVGGDYWQFLEHEHRLRGERTNREFRLGDHVVVLVHEVNEDRRQIEFALIEAKGEAAESRAPSPRKRPR